MRQYPIPAGRPAAVWLVVTGGLAGAWATAGDAATSLAAGPVWTSTFDDLLVAVACAALIASACWLWVVTTVTIVDLLLGGASTPRGLTRRLVVMACGVAVVAGVSGPALAAGGSDEHRLAGLPLPDRAVAGAAARPAQPPQHATPPAPTVRRTPRTAPVRREPIIVRSGDSLWSIAQSELGPDARLPEIDETWRALYDANRAAIGADPDLITPGQRLRTPLTLPPETDQ
jgi:hypothetical protein